MKYLLLILTLALPTFAQKTLSDAEQQQRYFTLTIASGASLSGSVRLEGCVIAAIEMPAWTAANLTFQHSNDGTNFSNLYDEYDNEVKVMTTGTTARTIRVSAGDWWFAKWLKIRSGTAETPVNQAADRTITITCR